MHQFQQLQLPRPRAPPPSPPVEHLQFHVVLPTNAFTAHRYYNSSYYRFYHVKPSPWLPNRLACERVRPLLLSGSYHNGGVCCCPLLALSGRHDTVIRRGSPKTSDSSCFFECCSLVICCCCAIYICVCVLCMQAEIFVDPGDKGDLPEVFDGE